MIVVGLSHRTAPVETRERFALHVEQIPGFLERLLARETVTEAMVVSTCNRFEIYAAGDLADLERTRLAILAEMALRASSTDHELSQCTYTFQNLDAIAHIFRVACSLDSMVVGESQVLGQVKEAYEIAIQARTIGPTLARILPRAFSTAKRVRSETGIATGSVSISSVAVDLALHIFGDLSAHEVLLLGAGEMAEAAARSLAKHGKDLRVCNRSFDRGAALARKLGAGVVPWEALERELASADIVVASTSSPSFVITRDMVCRAMSHRRGKTLLFVDIALPRNVESSVHKIGNVYAFNIDDLEEQAARAQKQRAGEKENAERIVLEEVGGFEAWSSALGVQPTLVALRAKTRAIFMGELERALGGRLRHLAEGDQQQLRHVMESAVNKWLHRPTATLKGASSEIDALQLLVFAQRLFGIETSDPETTASHADEDTTSAAH